MRLDAVALPEGAPRSRGRRDRFRQFIDSVGVILRGWWQLTQRA
jgi:hypothetical protein